MDLKIVASNIAKIYERNPKVEAVLLGGSVARDWYDQYSDIEIFVFWKESPTDEDRTTPIENLKADIIDFYPYEDEEWSETYITEGVKIEISNFLTDTIKNIINDVILSFETDLNKQCLVASVHDGVALSGDLLINRLKEKVNNYPNELSIAMIKENIHLGNRWNNREALLNRKDWFMLYKVMVDVQTNIMGMLFGLNRQYVHHPAFKWQKQTLQSMVITPKNIVNRLESIFLADPSNSIRELEVMIQDIYELIQREHPQIDLSSVIDKSLFLRPENEMK
ncbi:DUF4037 domain-containing protein [Bacillus shivajii]|uniref:DUF4037 domain-containing protein n=1 Tax=Bacillus shivajii TaxID=1983719 RepID=UPI001CF9981E|nr:DUF4037 domain-containing protein [Bacillus shivajii]UCZ55063.1 DUF4037 domain-containing protein [Bacillus shivajii]